tara:strand:- start:54 stop:1436 length:1383 start_codon:yes stop_codon:yes gene_type:complete
MKKNYKKNLIIFLLIFFFAGTYFFISSNIGKNNLNNLKDRLSNEQKQFIYKFFFPFKLISEQKKQLSKQREEIELFLLELELTMQKINNNVLTTKSNLRLNNNKNLEKYKILGGFYYGNYDIFGGSGYIDFFENNIFALSSRGALYYSKSINDNGILKQVKNNIDDFISFKQFRYGKGISVKDMLIYNNKIFVSYLDEMKEDCWNTSIIYGDMNYNNIIFEKLFSSKNCIHSTNNLDREFQAVQSGGRIVGFDENHILFSIGEYRSRYLAQDKDSVNGKIIKINIYNGDHEIISMGHRNPQGLYFDKENNFILETEHGPQGGDEINLIKVEKINKDKILNYGWPVVSAGEHYGGKTKKNKKKYEKYPLYKSHKKYGYIEPLKSFVPSIGISEIVKIKRNKYVVSSLKDKSLYFFELDEEYEIINLRRLEVFERIRDLNFYKNKLYLFFENTGSIGVINFG